MNDERTVNYIQSFERLVNPVRDTDTAIATAQEDHDKLGVSQYQHLKKDYVNQLADLISQAPESVQLKAVSQ